MVDILLLAWVVGSPDTVVTTTTPAANLSQHRVEFLNIEVVKLAQVVELLAACAHARHRADCRPHGCISESRRWTKRAFVVANHQRKSPAFCAHVLQSKPLVLKLTSFALPSPSRVTFLLEPPTVHARESLLISVPQ
jgi:hypothetical protein